MSVELQTVSREDAEIWHGMMTEELFNLPVEEAQNILIADDPVQTLEIRGDGKRVGFVAVNFQPRSVPDVLWVFVCVSVCLCLCLCLCLSLCLCLCFVS